MEGLFQPMHLLVIFFIALLFFGPKKLPELGKGIGEGFRAKMNGNEYLIVGAIFDREWLTVPRRARHYAVRTAYLGLLDGLFEGGLGDIEEFFGGGGRVADGVGDGAVGVEAVDDDAAVDGDDIAFGEDALGRGDGGA